MENKPTFPNQWSGGKPTVKPPQKKPSKVYLLVVLIIVLALAGGAGYYYLHTADRGKVEITPTSAAVSIKKSVAKEAAKPAKPEHPSVEQSAFVGFFPQTIKPGTNVVENVPLLPKSLPTLEQLDWAKPGDTVCWSNNTTTFDGESWSGGFSLKTVLPIHEKVIIIRTCNETDPWSPGGFVDAEKAERQLQKK